MGRSYDRAHRATNTEPPVQWTEDYPHKYCSKIEKGSKGKPNKAQKCDDCIAIKAARDKAQQRDTSGRRNEKMGWQSGELDWS